MLWHGLPTVPPARPKVSRLTNRETFGRGGVAVRRPRHNARGPRHNLLTGGGPWACRLFTSAVARPAPAALEAGAAPWSASHPPAAPWPRTRGGRAVS